MAYAATNHITGARNHQELIPNTRGYTESHMSALQERAQDVSDPVTKATDRGSSHQLLAPNSGRAAINSSKN